MRKTLFILLCLFVYIVAVGCVSAADMNNGDVTYSSDSDGYLDVEDAISMSSSGNSDIKRPVMELPRGYESKISGGSDESNDEIDLSAVETDSAVKNDTSSVESNGTVRKAPPASSDRIVVELKKGTTFVDVSVYERKSTLKDLQSLVDDAKDDSTVYLDCDYYGVKNSKVTLNKNLTIDGQGHTINCNKADKCFAFYSTKGTIVLKNLNIKNGHNNDLKKGGAIYIGGSASYTLINCNFTDNWAEDHGGAIYNDATKNLVLKNCLFRKNSVSDENGGAISSKGKVCVEDSTFDSNNANVDGGAIFCENDVNVTRCLFKYNNAEGAKMHQCYGGAICSKETVWINNSTFELNEAADYGGAVYAKHIYVRSSFDPILNLTTVSHFNANSAKDNDGGALYCENDAKIDSAIFEYNYANEDGGAICCNNVSLRNCLFYQNVATGTHFSACEGGAVFAKEDVHLMDNNTFGNNCTGTGGAISCDMLYFHEPSVNFSGNGWADRNPIVVHTCHYKGIEFNKDLDVDGKYTFEF